MRCEYKYKDGAQCMANTDKKMCTAHTLLVQMAKDKKKNNAKRYLKTKDTRPSRAKPKKEIIIKKEYVDEGFYDHTAPWKCGLAEKASCLKCDHKPSYSKYMADRIKRLNESKNNL